MKLLSKYGKTEEHWDCYNKKVTNGFHILVRKDLSKDTYEVGGKFPEGFENFDRENYLDYIEELTEADIPIIEKSGMNYNYLGTGASAGGKEEDEEIPEEDEEIQEEDSMDELLESIN